jgi:small subunit ribosomal protein S17
MKSRTKSIGITTFLPNQKCTDNNCPFHGTLKVRGKQFAGTVVSSKMQRSAIVEWEGKKFVPKFERYMRTRTKVAAHNPECITAREGDVVTVAECRPISKTKSFVIVEVQGRETKYALRKEALEEGKHRIKAKEEENLAESKEDKEE